MNPLLRPTLAIALLFLATTVPALEISLTVEGNVEEIQAVLEFIKTLNAENAAEDDPLKINVHSIAAPGGTEAGKGGSGEIEEPPLSLERPEVLPAKGAPGAPFIVTVNVRDKYDEVDTLSVRMSGTSLSTDLYDDGTHGDKTPADGLWTATLTPLDVTPSGAYRLDIVAYAKDGQALTALKPDGTVIKLTAATELTIER